MPDRRSHRGPHPEDAELFAEAAWPALRFATADLSWLLSRGYASTSALKIVGDRYSLDKRQRIAVARCACADDDAERRRRHEVDRHKLHEQEIWLDGYNVLTSIEAALGGGVILKARDGCLRDMASMHGNYRKVAETMPAIDLIGRTLADDGVEKSHWLLDRPVSNSGRLKRMLLNAALQAGWDWQVELVTNPDAELAQTPHIVATSDSEIIDRCRRWFNLVRRVIESRVPQACVVDLS